MALQKQQSWAFVCFFYRIQNTEYRRFKNSTEIQNTESWNKKSRSTEYRKIFGDPAHLCCPRHFPTFGFNIENIYKPVVQYFDCNKPAKLGNFVTSLTMVQEFPYLKPRGHTGQH